MKKNKPERKDQQAALIIRTLAEQSTDRREYPFYEKFHEGCYIQSHDHKHKVVLKEPREDREYRLINDLKKELVVYKIDTGVITEHEAGDNKCDFGIYSEDDLLILVELKGADYKKAIEQISKTTKTLGIGSQIKVKKLLVRVVVSNGRGVPNVQTTDLAQLKRLITTINGLFREEYIKKKSQQLEETLSKL